MAKALTKQVTARPAVNARAAPHSAKPILIALEDRTAERRIDCKVSHSLTKPLNGGRAAIESAPTKKERPSRGHPSQQPAQAIEIAGPGRALDRAAADEQQRLVGRVIDHVIERRGERDAGGAAKPEAMKTNAAPSAAVTIPMFSIVLWASRRLRSFSTVA